MYEANCTRQRAIITLVSRHHSVVAEDMTEGELFKLYKLDELKKKILRIGL